MNNWVMIGLLALGLKISEFQAVDTHLKSYYEPVIGQHLSPKNTVFVFDWHEVLQRQNYRRITFKLLFRLKHSFMYLLRPSFWQDIRELLSKKMVAEKMLEKMSEKYPGLASLKDEFVKAVNEEPLIDENIELLKKLKDQGYTVYMLSNIAAETLAKLRLIHPEVLNLFDAIYMPSEENGYIQKPNPEFYAKFKELLSERGDGNKTMIFVDDREKNVKAGYDAGLYGIVFTSTDEFKKILFELKVLEIEA